MRTMSLSTSLEHLVLRVKPQLFLLRHETGLEFFGSFGKGYARFDYQAMIVAGLNADGFGRDNWVAGGKQGLFEQDNFTSPAYVARLDYKGVPGLRVGAAFTIVMT